MRLCPKLISEKLLDKLFQTYGKMRQSQITIDVRCVFVGIAACADGSIDAKISFCFRLYAPASSPNIITKSDVDQLLFTFGKLRDTQKTIIKSSSTLMTIGHSQSQTLLRRQLSTSPKSFPDSTITMAHANQTDILSSVLSTRIDDPQEILAAPRQISLAELPPSIQEANRVLSFKGESYLSQVSFFSFAQHDLKSKGTEFNPEIVDSQTKSGISSITATPIPARQRKFKRRQSDDQVQDEYLSKVTTTMFEDLDLQSDEIELKDFLRFVHNNPTSFPSLDKIKMLVGKFDDRHMALEEHTIFQEIVSKSTFKVGDVCYILSMKWFQLWLNYVQQSNASSSNKPPGRIDNSDIVSKQQDDEVSVLTGFVRLRDNIVEDIDYVVLTSEAWRTLFLWYGGAPVIERSISRDFTAVPKPKPKLVSSKSTIQLGARDYMVDLYPLVLGIGFSNERNIISKCICSADITVDELKELVCVQLHLDSTLMWQLNMSFKNQEMITIEDYDLSLRVLGLTSSHTIWITPFRPKHERSTSARMSLWLLRRASSSSSSKSVKPFTMTEDNSPSPSDYVPMSLVGLHNMGNTCFLNAALQALIHIYPLVDYFLYDRYLVDYLQPEKPSKCVTEMFFKLLKQLWKGKSFTSIVPQHLLGALVERAPQFSGGDQQDAQEVLGLILDCIHTDLNIVAKKRNIPMQNPDYKGQKDSELASFYWTNHLRKDASVIVSLFEGQFKSHTQCITCKHEIVTFNPFMFLSVPLSFSPLRIFNVTIVGRGYAPITRRLNVKSDGTVQLLLDVLRDLQLADGQSGHEKSNFVLADIQGSYVFRLFDPETPLTYIRSRDFIVAYEVDNSNSHSIDDFSIDLNDSSQDMLMVLFRAEKVENTTKGELARRELFGLPLVLSQKQNQIVAKDLYMEVYEMLKTVYDLPGNFDKAIGQFPFRLHLVNHDGSICSKCSTNCGDDNGCLGCQITLSDSATIKRAFNQSVALEWTDTVSFPAFKSLLSKTYQQAASVAVESADSNLVYTTLEDIMLEYEKPELMSEDDFYCPRCQAKRPGIKRETVWRFPPILMIQLKRFAFTMNECLKNHRLVKFPIDNFDVGPFVTPRAEGTNKKLTELLPYLKPDNSHMPLPPKKDQTAVPQPYRLTSMISHLGNFYDGHYIAHAADRNHSNWYVFNDDRVQLVEVSGSSVCSNNAYVLVYERCHIPSLDILRQEMMDASKSNLEGKHGL